MAFSMKLPAAKGKKGKSSQSQQKQYGLLLPASASSPSSLARGAGFNAFTAAAAAAARSSPSAAGDAAATRRQVGAEAARSTQQAQAARAHAQALAEDPSAFDYDGVYDSLQRERSAKRGELERARAAERRQPKYISTLLEQAKIREVENERMRERRLLNERRAEDALYGDKEKLVSASYKRKLVEMRRWDEEDRRLAAVEAATDVTKQGEHALAGFYANLMTRNIAMGGDTSRATSQYTAGRARQGDDGDRDEPTRKRRNMGESEAGGDGGEKLQPRSVETARDGEQRDERDERDERQGAHEARVPGPEPAAAKTETEAVRSKEDAIAAARARFLARKAQRASASSR